jgi:1L-myo-inositol 1-phosphate cytidylyltransferase
MMHAVILAAGDGGRLYPLTGDTPKPLLKVAGRPLINHVLDNLYAAGVRQATIVLGHHGDKIRAALATHQPPGMMIRFVDNPRYDAENARSLWEARPFVSGSFVLAMADHLVEPALIRSLIASGNGRCALAVDRAGPGDPRADEATRADVRGGLVVDLGKALDAWNALDTGVFWCTPAIFDAFTPQSVNGEAGAIFASLARTGRLEAVDVTGMRWMDVDTLVDLQTAERWIGEQPAVPA